MVSMHNFLIHFGMLGLSNKVVRFSFIILQLIFLNAMYGGLGQSLGALIGGKLQQNFGTASTFVRAGLFDLCFVGLVVAYLSCRVTGFRDPQPLQVESKKRGRRRI